MLGTFDLRLFGRWVMSGDTPEEFLWDLYDQIVFSGNLNTSVSGSKVFISQQENYHGDAEERAQFRWTPEWEAMHSAYFVAIISEGGGIPVSVELPSDSYIHLHSARIVNIVNDRLFNESHNNRINRVAMYKYGPDTPEYFNVIYNKTYHDYPYQDFSHMNVINYLILKGALSVQRTSESAQWGLLSQEEVDAYSEEKQKEHAALAKEEKDLLAEAATKKRGRKPVK